MDRRWLLITGVAALMVWSSAPGAQEARLPVIGFLSGASAGSFAHLVDAFRDGLEERGFVDGENVKIDFRWAEGDYQRLPGLAVELASEDVAVILASGGDRPTQAAMAATSTIPIVFTGSDDPVRFGLVESLSKPGGNVTGASLFTSVVEIKKLELLHDVLPEARQIGMLVNPDNPTAGSDARDIEAAARAMGMALHLVEARDPAGIEAAFGVFRTASPDGLLIGHDPFFNSQREQIVTLAAELGIPAVYEHREFVLIGGLMSYGNPITENYRMAGDYVGRILKGARPEDLPVQQATKFELLVNLTTAAEQEVEFPPSILVRADEIIE